MCAAHELHDHAARHVAVFVDVDGAFGIGDEELAVAEAEHAQRSEVSDAVRDAREVCLSFGGFGAEVRDGPRLFLVEGEDLDAALVGDGEGGVEHVDAVAFGRDVELVVFAEEVYLRAAELEETGLTRR